MQKQDYYNELFELGQQKMNFILRRFKKEGLVTPKKLFIDGTKIDANANRYTFAWRGSINYHLAGLLDTIDSLYSIYNTFLNENGYGVKYSLVNAQMFIIEGMDKVRSVIEKNRKRKLTKHKKLSNNTIIEIDNCSPLEIIKLQKNLLKIAAGEDTRFVYGKGKRKPEIQQLYKELENCGIPAQKPDSKTLYPEIRCVDAQTAAAVNIKPSAYINIMLRKMPEGIRS